jgi:hypothetical protein
LHGQLVEDPGPGMCLINCSNFGEMNFWWIVTLFLLIIDFEKALYSGEIVQSNQWNSIRQILLFHKICRQSQSSALRDGLIVGTLPFRSRIRGGDFEGEDLNPVSRKRTLSDDPEGDLNGKEEGVDEGATDFAGLSLQPNVGPVGQTNDEMLREDEERRQYEIESAFSELPTGYDEEDERAMERDFGDTLTDDEFTDSKFSDFIPNEAGAADGDQDGPQEGSHGPFRNDQEPALSKGPVGASNDAKPSLVCNGSTRESVGGGSELAAASSGEPPEELVPGPRSCGTVPSVNIQRATLIYKSRWGWIMLPRVHSINSSKSAYRRALA